MESGPLEIGSTLDGRYRIERVLGVGGFATVYFATEVASDRELAIKVLNQPLMHRARFQREVEAVAKLRDPHSVRLFTHGETNDGHPYIVFEYVPGRDLKDILQDVNALPSDAVVRVLRQVLHSLHEAHSVGVVHRDVKPANIRIFEHDGDPWCAKLIDFGIAGLQQPTDARLTKTGELLGTPRYMSPEQLLSSPMGPASDIYSLGVVGLEMLIGLDQMHGARWSDQLDRLRTGHSFAVGTEQAHLDRVLARMTARAPENRYQSAEAVLYALDNPQAAPMRAPSPTPMTVREPGRASPPQVGALRPSSTSVADTSTGRQPNSRKNFAIAFGIMLACVSIAIAGTTYLNRPESNPPPPAPATRNLGSMLAGAEPEAEVAEPSTSVDLGAPSDEPIWRSLKPVKSGCGSEPPSPGFAHRQVNIQDMFRDRPRKYMVRIPRGYRTETRHSVWLLFESMIFGPEDLIAMTGIEEFADEHKIVLMAFPKSGASTSMRDAEDTELVARALVATEEEFCIDRDRVFGFAHGKGGSFLRGLICEIKLTAIANVGDWAQTAAFCDEPFPYIRFSGDDDRYSRPNAVQVNCLGEGPLLTRKTLESSWRTVNRCNGDDVAWQPRLPHGTCRTWSCEKPFVSCTYPGGHFFPDRKPNLIVDPCEAALPRFRILDATKRFFDQVSER